jgi:hypothetical protein
MANALGTPPVLKQYRITLLTSNKAATLTLRNPRQQSGQEHICQIYKLIKRLRRNGNLITILWVPTSEDNKLLGLAKEQARAATQEDATPYTELPRMKSTALNMARSQVGTSEGLPEKVGKHAKRVDAALPGKHTRQLYDRLSCKEASVLAQIWTGMEQVVRIFLRNEYDVTYLDMLQASLQILAARNYPSNEFLRLMPTIEGTLSCPKVISQLEGAPGVGGPKTLPYCEDRVCVRWSHFFLISELKKRY